MTYRTEELLASVPKDRESQLKKDLAVELYERFMLALSLCTITEPAKRLVTAAIDETLNMALCNIISPLNLESQHTKPEGTS